MSWVKIVLVAAVGAGAYHYWKGEKPAPQQVAAASASGFVTLPGDSGPLSKGVHVIAAENCPEEAAQRADRLADQLAKAGLPVQRGHQASFNLGNAGPAAAQQISAVMNGELPIVFVHGKAKSNPSLDEVLAEYRGAK
ncbi:MAG TPA: hypothetical protein VFH35_03165 [Ramlibacter sp.]|nr:hypothetical protein [Ramlibacter sp.]